MGGKLKVYEADAEANEEKSWRCESCGTYIQHDDYKPYCWQCFDYWKSVDEGLFEIYD